MQVKYNRYNSEIKFRAWCNINNEMIYQTKKIDMFKYNIYNRTILQKYDIVMQWSGLLDKNGKEIYECDIIKDGLRFLFVKFTNGGFNFFTKYGELHKNIDTNYLEVVGNIFENYDLFQFKK